MGIIIVEAVFWSILTITYMIKGYISLDAAYIGTTIAIATVCLIFKDKGDG